MKKIDLSRELAVVTVIGRKGLDRGLVGKKKVFFPGGESGRLPLPWLEAKAGELARAALESGNFTVADLADPVRPDSSATLMADPYLPLPELVILGGGHIALPLSTLGRLLGYRVVVADDRPEFASPGRFPGADRVICRSFDRIVEELSLGPRSSVVIVTRGHRHDLECLRMVIGHHLAYLGMIGSRRKIRVVRQQLEEEGIDPARLEAVHMPIGLDIGAQTPEEIAVSIAAEMVLERRGGSSSQLKNCSPGDRAPARSFEIPAAVDREILRAVAGQSGGGAPAVLATITRTRGSTPRKAGSKMLVYRDGRIIGTVGGGLGESQIRREAAIALEEGCPRTRTVSMNADAAAEEGMICGGVMEVFIDPAGSLAWLLGGGVSVEEE